MRFVERLVVVAHCILPALCMLSSHALSPDGSCSSPRPLAVTPARDGVDADAGSPSADDGVGYIATNASAPVATGPSAVARSLHGRLLCASQVAYASDASSAAYLRGVGFRAGTQVRRLSRGVNSVVVGWAPFVVGGGRAPDIFVGFRGTRTASPLDWLLNADLQLDPFVVSEEVVRSVGPFGGPEHDTMVMEAFRGSAGRVHSGFYSAASALYEPIRETVEDMLREWTEKYSGEGCAPDIYITGHSKGGAMATLTAALLKMDASVPDPKAVVTFGSPRVGDSQFQSYYNSVLGMKKLHVSYEAHLDIIPLLPPTSPTLMEEMMAEDKKLGSAVEKILWSDTSIRAREKRRRSPTAWDYKPVGSRLFIAPDSSIIPIDGTGKCVDCPSDEERIRDFETKTILASGMFRAAHGSSCPGEKCDGRYMLAVAPEICGNMS